MQPISKRAVVACGYDALIADDHCAYVVSYAGRSGRDDLCDVREIVVDGGSHGIPKML